MISIKYGFMGINYTTVSACSTSNTAFMDALTYIRLGKSEIMVAGWLGSAYHCSIRGWLYLDEAMSTRNDDPQHASGHSMSTGMVL